MRLVTRPHHDGFCSITIGSEHVLDGLAMTEIIAAQLASCGNGRRLRADTTRTPGEVLAAALADRKELQAAIDQARCAACSLANELATYSLSPEPRFVRRVGDDEA
jgi:hypothetical protein